MCKKVISVNGISHFLYCDDYNRAVQNLEFWKKRLEEDKLELEKAMRIFSSIVEEHIKSRYKTLDSL